MEKGVKGKSQGQKEINSVTKKKGWYEGSQ